MNPTPENIIVTRPTKVVYREGNLLIKLFVEGYSGADVFNEAHNIAIVEETGFKIPKLVNVQKINNRWAITTEFIEGKTLSQLVKENPASVDAYMEHLVDIQLEMHKYSAEKLRHNTEKMHAYISQSGLNATSRYELHTRLNSLPRHSKLCHGDFCFSNVMVTPSDEAYVIDWAHATNGNASADAARSYLIFHINGESERAEKYLDLFCRKSDTARQYVQKWMAIMAAGQLVKNRPEEKELLLNWANVVEY
ncbi:MAG: aminoglycoside phosphotransferase family protein [Syntrophorhabdaceae bacterium]|nr:aminoglycoside phosphotransferase family protein [Syntrophorhabdaceae bacterium]